MAYDGRISFGNKELIAHVRTYFLARALGISAVVMPRSQVQGQLDETGDPDVYAANLADVSKAPWYDPAVPASAEFAGILALGVSNLESSEDSAEVTQFTGDGGWVGRARRGTVDFVFDAIVVASTEAGAAFGYRWLNTSIRAGSRDCGSGEVMEYRDTKDAGARSLARRAVRLTRGIEITRKRANDCSVLWSVSFTLTSGDPETYGAHAVGLASGLGSAEVGTIGIVTPVPPPVDLVETLCPSPDYTPLYDPEYPALIEPPTAPKIVPAGWQFTPGRTYRRWWGQTVSKRSILVGAKPDVWVYTGAEEARNIRVSLWAQGADPTTASCSALYSVVISYIPADSVFVIDPFGEHSYAYVSGSPSEARRADSLVFSRSGGPVEWPVLDTSKVDLGVTGGYVVSVDQLEKMDAPGTYEGGDGVSVTVNLRPLLL